MKYFRIFIIIIFSSIKMVYNMNQIITHGRPNSKIAVIRNIYNNKVYNNKVYNTNISQAPARVNTKSFFSRPMVEQVNRRPSGCSSCGK